MQAVLLVEKKPVENQLVQVKNVGGPARLKETGQKSIS